jgi:hypothetical protein
MADLNVTFLPPKNTPRCVRTWFDKTRRPVLVLEREAVNVWNRKPSTCFFIQIFYFRSFISYFLFRLLSFYFPFLFVYLPFVSISCGSFFDPKRMLNFEIGHAVRHIRKILFMMMMMMMMMMI